MNQSQKQEILYWQSRLSYFPLHSIIIDNNYQIVYRKSTRINNTTPIVLLHGISSGSSSWLMQLENLSKNRQIFAWDTPGYSNSTPISQTIPSSREYSYLLDLWLNALDINRIHLVAHSMGALIASSFARYSPMKLASLLLLSPAYGYSSIKPSIREEKYNNRLNLLNLYGTVGLARQRSQKLYTSNANSAVRSWIKWNILQVNTSGYRKALILLFNNNLITDLKFWKTQHAAYNIPIEVVVGSEDMIISLNNCIHIAKTVGVKLNILSGLGHACYIEHSLIINQLIEKFIEQSEQTKKK